MLKKRYMVIGILAFCLTTTLFIGIATSGKKEDPLWTTISDLQADVDSLNATIAEQEARISELESQPTTGFLSKPAYDSGWRNMPEGATLVLTHNLDSTKVFVYVMGYTEQGHAGFDGINQMAYGGFSPWGDGVFWYDLTGSTIRIYREGGDTSYEQVRVMIWKISEPPM